MKILVTGAVGFIGFHTVKELLKEGHEVTGLDNINDYYDLELKKARKTQIDKFLSSNQNKGQFSFYKSDLCDLKSLKKIFSKNKFEQIIHLAAQAGVRYSFEKPSSYIDSNIKGFFNLLEIAKDKKIKHFIFASSSSVYGMSEKISFSEDQTTDQQVSLYAATKKIDEILAQTYSHLYEMPITALRFFTVYGPWGRPDMAYFKFTKAIYEKKIIEVYNSGKMSRDYTYIDDITDGIMKSLKKIPKKAVKKGYSSDSMFNIYNLGNDKPIELLNFISILEKTCNRKAKKIFSPLQKGDVISTRANINKSMKDLNYSPSTSLEEGLKKFNDWFVEFYKKDI